MNKLIIPKVKATVQQATVNIPFKIQVTNGDLVLKARKQAPKHHGYVVIITDTRWKARGKITFYDATHGEIDHASFVDVKLTAHFIWQKHYKEEMELRGILENVGRFCFSGWGLCKMEIYDSKDNNTLFYAQGQVETEIISSK